MSEYDDRCRWAEISLNRDMKKKKFSEKVIKNE